MAISYNVRPLTDGLVLMLDPANPRSYSGTGTSWYDIGPNGYHATLINGPTYGGTGGSSYFSCDGSNDNISISE